MNTKAHQWLEATRAGFSSNGIAWDWHDVGPYMIVMDWVDGEPAMVLTTRTGRSSFAICLSSIGKYADPSGVPNPEGVRELWRALPELGREQTESELRYLTDAVLRYTPQLIGMPPEPRAVQVAGKSPLVEIEHVDENGKRLSEVAM